MRSSNIFNKIFPNNSSTKAIIGTPVHKVTLPRTNSSQSLIQTNKTNLEKASLSNASSYLSYRPNKNSGKPFKEKVSHVSVNTVSNTSNININNPLLKVQKLRKPIPKTLNQEFTSFVSKRKSETDANLQENNLASRQHNIFQAWRHNTQTQQEKLYSSHTQTIKQCLPFATLSEKKKQEKHGQNFCVRGFCHDTNKLSKSPTKWDLIQRGILTVFTFDDTPDKDLISNYHTMRNGWWVAGTSGQLDIWGSHLSTSHIGAVLGAALNLAPVIGPLINLASSALGLVIDGRLQMNVNIAQDTLANGIVARLSSHSTNPKELEKIVNKISQINKQDMLCLSLLQHKAKEDAENAKNNPYNAAMQEQANTSKKELAELLNKTLSNILKVLDDTNTNDKNSKHSNQPMPQLQENLLNEPYKSQASILSIYLANNDIGAVNKQYQEWLYINANAGIEQKQAKYSEITKKILESKANTPNKLINIPHNYCRDYRGNVNNFREVKNAHAYQNAVRILSVAAHATAWGFGMPILSVPIIIAKGLLQLGTSGFDEIIRYRFRLGTVAKDGAKDLMNEDMVDNGLCYSGREQDVLEWEQSLVNHLKPKIRQEIAALQVKINDLIRNRNSQDYRGKLQQLSQEKQTLEYKLNTLSTLPNYYSNLASGEIIAFSDYKFDERNLSITFNENIIWDSADYTKYLLLQDKLTLCKNTSNKQKEAFESFKQMKELVTNNINKHDIRARKFKEAKQALDAANANQNLPMLIEKQEYLQNFIQSLQQHYNSKSSNETMDNFFISQGINSTTFKQKLIDLNNELKQVSRKIENIQKVKIEYSRLCVNYTTSKLRNMQDTVSELCIDKTKAANHFKSKTKMREEQCNKVIERRLVHQTDKVKEINCKIFSYLTKDGVSINKYARLIASKSMPERIAILSEIKDNSTRKVIMNLLTKRAFEYDALIIMNKDVEALKLSLMAAEAQKNPDGTYTLIDSKGKNIVIDSKTHQRLIQGHNNISSENQWIKKLFTNQAFFHWHTSGADSGKPGELLSQYIYRFNTAALRFATAISGFSIATSHALQNDESQIMGSSSTENQGLLNPNLVDAGNADNIARIIGYGATGSGVLAYILFGIWQLKYNKAYMANNPNIANIFKEKQEKLQNAYNKYSPANDFAKDIDKLNNEKISEEETKEIQKRLAGFVDKLYHSHTDLVKDMHSINALFNTAKIDFNNHTDKDNFTNCTLPDEINLKTSIEGVEGEISLFSATTANTAYKLADVRGMHGKLRRTRAALRALPQHSATLGKQAVVNIATYPWETYKTHKSYKHIKQENPLGKLLSISKEFSNSLTSTTSIAHNYVPL